MAKKNEYSSGGDNKAIPPELLVMIGVDTTHKENDKHPDWDIRAFNKVTPEKVEMLRTVGAQVPAVQVNMVETAELLPFLKPQWIEKAKIAWKQYSPDSETDLPLKLAVVSRGRQRTNAGRALNIVLATEGQPRFYMPVRVGGTVDDSMAFGLRIIENAARTNMTPLEKAREMRRYLDMFGGTREKCMTFFDVQPLQRVDWHLSLLDLVAEVQKAIDGGKLSASKAQPWHSYPGDDQRKFLKEHLNPTDGAKGEGDSEGGGDGEGGENQLPGNAPAASTPKGHAVPRATMKRLFEESRNGRIKLQKQYAETLGWASGELRGEAIPSQIIDALRAVAALDAEEEAASAAAKAQKEAKKAEVDAKRKAGEPVKGRQPKPVQPDNKPSVSMADIAAEVLAKKPATAAAPSVADLAAEVMAKLKPNGAPPAEKIEVTEEVTF